MPLRCLPNPLTLFETSPPHCQSITNFLPFWKVCFDHRRWNAWSILSKSRFDTFTVLAAGGNRQTGSCQITSSPFSMANWWIPDSRDGALSLFYYVGLLYRIDLLRFSKYWNKVNAYHAVQVSMFFVLQEISKWFAVKSSFLNYYSCQVHRTYLMRNLISLENNDRYLM